MRVLLTNLSNELYKSSRLQLNESARQHGITEIRSYDFEDLKGSAFYVEHKHILDQPRGIGYWLWKPYIVLEAMKELSEGDIVIYSDSGIEVTGNLEPLINICSKEQPVVLFGNGNLLNASWTKRDCFILMGCDNKAYWFSLQCDAAFALFRKSAEGIQFLEKWLEYGSDERILTDLPNTCGKKDLISFVEHRWDQSILSLLAHKFNLPLYRMPSQYGNHYKMPVFRVEGEFNSVNQLKPPVNYYARKPYYNSPYYQLLDHHRSKKGGAQKKQTGLSVTRALRKLWRRVGGALSLWYYKNLSR